MTELTHQNDERLSDSARESFEIIIQKPANWFVSVRQLMWDYREEKARTEEESEKIVQELIDAGYLSKNRFHGYNVHKTP